MNYYIFVAAVLSCGMLHAAEATASGIAKWSWDKLGEGYQWADKTWQSAGLYVVGARVAYKIGAAVQYNYLPTEGQQKRQNTVAQVDKLLTAKNAFQHCIVKHRGSETNRLGFPSACEDAKAELWQAGGKDEATRIIALFKEFTKQR